MSQAGSPTSELRVRHVLVPLDGSELSLQAMPTGRALADRFGAELQTVSVAGRLDDEGRLRGLASATLGVEAGDRRACVIVGGDPADVITHRAKALGSCVVCLASHGRGRLGGAVVGSVARSVLQGSSDPVVVLGPSSDNPGWSPRPRGWPAPLSVPRIVACVDGSDASEQVLPIAAAWARALEMSLTILTVVDDLPPPLRSQYQESRFGGHTDAAQYLDELARQWRGEVADVDGVVLRDPISPANGIRLHLAERPAGMVALTTQARSGLQRVLLGAAAADIVHASVAPCLVAPVRT